MKEMKLVWVICPLFLVVILLSMIALQWYFANTIRHDYYKRVERELKSTVGLVAVALHPYGAELKTDEVNGLCERLGLASGYRITVLLSSGKVIGDSDRKPGEMDNHSQRAEILQAHANDYGQSRRYSETLQQWMMYVARLVELEGDKTAIVRVSLPLSDIDNSLTLIKIRVMIAGFIVALMAALISIFVSWRISRPLEELRKGAEAFTADSVPEELPPSRVLEINALSDTINQMMKRLHNLELMRRDFVANVSHELKTPITSIKGFTETLLDGAMDNREDLERFLKIIDKQSNRLQSIVEDLLILSSIEHGADRNEIDLQENSLDDVVGAAVLSCRTKADKKNISVEIGGIAALKAKINIQLFEQALINLIDNAIKYSDSGTTVSITGYTEDKEIVLSVRDRGAGIEKEHLSRLFERFYRVDKSRSRTLGGTGLGLAIVRRVAIAHGGRVEVKSELGKGSVFSLILPKMD